MNKFIKSRIYELENQLVKLDNTLIGKNAEERVNSIKQTMSVMAAINDNRVLLGLTSKYDSHFDEQQYRKQYES